MDWKKTTKGWRDDSNKLQKQPDKDLNNRTFKVLVEVSDHDS